MGGYNGQRSRVAYSSNVWLRCVSGLGSSSACNVSSLGNANYTSASHTGVGVAPCFPCGQS